MIDAVREVKDGLVKPSNGTVEIDFASPSSEIDLSRSCLPVEIYGLILQEVGHGSDLVSVARASRILQLEAERSV